MLSFRLCTQQDIPVASAILAHAYHFSDNREDMLYRYWLLQPDGCWLAILDDVPVGFGGAINYGSFSYVGMICVEPSVQRRGIGEALTRHIMTARDERVCPTLLLESNPKASSLYKRIGFVSDDKTVLLRLSTPQENIPLSDEVSSLQASDISELVEFDQRFFGARREKIFVPYLTKNTQRAFATRDATGTITGYIVAKSEGLGPWVASTVESAEKLLTHALTLPFQAPPSVAIPLSNESGHNLLHRYGFLHEEVTDMHMRFGPPVPSLHRDMIYGEASFAVG